MNLNFITQRTKIEEVGLNRTADILFLILIAIITCGSIYAVKTKTWAGIYYIEAIIVSLIGIFIIKYREKSLLFAYLLVFGLIIGIFELFADFLLVDVMKTLVYTTTGPMIIRSPLNMPVLWMTVVVIQGYFSLRVTNWLEDKTHKKLYADIAGSLIGGAVAGLTIGFFEALAFQAHWWRYIDAPFVVMGQIPLFVPLAAFIMFATFLPWFRILARKKSQWILIKGFGFSMTIAIAYSVCFYLPKVVTPYININNYFK